MNKILSTIFLAIVLIGMSSFTVTRNDIKAEGECGDNCHWSYDGYTLSIFPVDESKKSSTDNYNTKSNLAPWKKKGITIRKVKIGEKVQRIGDCAFYDLQDLQEVEFSSTNLSAIGWGAFMDCSQLSKLKLPDGLDDIGKIAFANCNSLTSITIPDHCRVGEQAFANCRNLRSIYMNPTCIIGKNAFAGEVIDNGMKRHTLYTGEVMNAPTYINTTNCQEYGLSKKSIAEMPVIIPEKTEYQLTFSDVDSQIPEGLYKRNNTYALVIGNQDYRFASDVAGALHDANIFAEYCRKTLGIPTDNIHLVENGTKEMIESEELDNWLGTLPERDKKTLIVYYAGNGMPDAEDHNKAYILPVEVRATTPQSGISLNDFCRQLGDLGFNQTTVFIDAGFNGMNRDNEGIADKLRGMAAEQEKLAELPGNMVVFSASQGKESALGYPPTRHGLFTYWLLKEIKDKNGIMSLGTLSDRLTTKVAQTAPIIKKNKTQTPQVKTSGILANKWRSIRL